MNCPICSAEMEPGAIVCAKCHATKVIQRTPVGVVAGWVGIISALLAVMAWVPIPVLMFAGVDLHGYPWLFPVIGTIVAVAASWYSRTTRHAAWIPYETYES